ncbi:uncharacterized protein B0T15DRAFT_177131 [Chaetomium strumarium]|uniref:Uncharacterized protein n=1 Tax=Chaetomium strumarium TaxID=1170767 RepID=A0AAJ0M397_9PEZI|nr:hypothetical protein B0T15DRAFT_177131 [Chaetomium strumarium]
MDKAGKAISQSLARIGPAAAGLGAAIEPSVSAATKITADYAKEIGKKASNFASKHPAVVAGVVLGTAIAAAPPLVLPAVGFGNGVAAGSVAAGIQSWMGNVAAGSWFAVCQSAGAGGAGAAVVNGAAQVAGAVVGAAVAGGNHVLGKTKKV